MTRNTNERDDQDAGELNDETNDDESGRSPVLRSFVRRRKAVHLSDLLGSPSGWMPAGEKSTRSSRA